MGEEVVSGGSGGSSSRIKTGKNYGRPFGFSLWSSNNGEGKATKTLAAISCPVAEVLLDDRSTALITDDYEKSLLSIESDCSTVVMSPTVDGEDESFAASSVTLSLTEPMGYDYSGLKEL